MAAAPRQMFHKVFSCARKQKDGDSVLVPFFFPRTKLSTTLRVVVGAREACCAEY